MKTRNGFVSNSSSSSFVVAAPPKKPCMVQTTVSLDLAQPGNHDEKIYSIVELDKFVFDMRGDEYKPNWYEKAVKAIKQGKVIYTGSFSNESDELLDMLFFDYGIDKDRLGEGVVIFENEAGC
jgi:hypothetical protein